MATYDSDRIAHIHQELHSHLPTESALRVKTLESLLVEKGLLSADAVDVWLEKYADKVGPKDGAQVIARAWLDADFAERLRQDGLSGFIELGTVGEDSGFELAAVFNTDTVHNLVVCTLCSCYPLRLIGMSPTWYKSNEYRARAVRDPRGVLRDFGVEIGDDVEVRVWDSTSERRYLVVPQRPVDTDGWSQDDLAALVTRDSMIGAQRDLSPKQGAA